MVPQAICERIPKDKLVSSELRTGRRGGSSIDPLTCNRPRGEVRENAQDIFPTFPKILSLPIKQRGEFEVQNIYIFRKLFVLENKMMDSGYLEIQGSQKEKSPILVV